MAVGRKTGGRQKGSRNRAAAEREAKLAAMAAVIEPKIPNAFTGDAHAFLMTVYKDPASPPAARMAAAQTAIEYEKPRLKSVEANIRHAVSFEERLAALEQEFPEDSAEVQD